MTHAEAKELLLEEAYGELPPHVAAEVAEHALGCDECRAEEARIAGVRKSFAPLAGLEEPAAGFDERILAAARAEAQLTHDGNIGQVVDVTATEAPSGIEAASIDAYARPLASPAARRRPKWMKAAAAAASVAAVAALAVVVGSSNGSKRAAPQESYAIRVAPQVAVSTDRTADEAPPPPPPPAERASSAQQAVERERSAQQQAVERERSGQQQAMQRERTAQAQRDDRGPTTFVKPKEVPAPSAPPQPSKMAAKTRATEEVAGGTAPAPSTGSRAVASKAPAGAASNAPAAATSSAPAAAASSAPAAAAAPDARMAQAANRNDLAAARSDSQSAAPEAPPAELERRAGEARRSGNYPLAASLYRQAARGRTDDASSAAWDLAHAVECLSAAGSFDEARAVRDELSQRYPAESGAFSAARRALREVDSRQ
jgi:hypothetical protein